MHPLRGDRFLNANRRSKRWLEFSKSVGIWRSRPGCQSSLLLRPLADRTISRAAGRVLLCFWLTRPASRSNLVHGLLMKRLLDGQFEQSGLTLTELHHIEQSLCKSLIALYHARIRYPDAGSRNLAS